MKRGARGRRRRRLNRVRRIASAVASALAPDAPGQVYRIVHNRTATAYYTLGSMLDIAIYADGPKKEPEL